MLPEALSNELCSLKPDVDRLTKCVEFLVSDEGRVLSTKFYSAVIHSQRRFTYKEVLAILQRKPNDRIERMLHDANALAQRIRRARFKAGSLDLDFPEMKIRLDERGRVARIERVENDVSHQLIEEFMLLANEAVAGRLMSQNVHGDLPRARGAGRTAAAGIPRGSAQPPGALRESDEAGGGSEAACKSSIRFPSARRSRSGFSARSCAPVTRWSRSVITGWPRPNTRISRRLSGGMPTWWCIARCSRKATARSIR